MNIIRGLGLLLAIFVWGCGSNSSSSATKTAPDAPASSPDSVVAQNDLPGLPSPEISNSDASVPSDVAVVPQEDGQAVIVVVNPNPDTAASEDTLPPSPPPATADGPTSPPPADAQPALPPPADGAPLLGGTTLVASTSTPDDNTDPATCSTVELGIQAFSADQTYDIVMPDCHRVSGTVTLADPLPSGAVYVNGMVNAFKIIRDGAGRVTDTVSYAASITPVDSTHFRYSMSVPADTYKMMYQFIVKSGALIPSTADRVGEEEITIGQAAIKHDVTLPAIDVVTLTATVTGSDALAANGSFRLINIMLLNAEHTLLTSGTSLGGGASVPIGMWIPRNSFTPTVMVQESPVAMAPYASGFVSQFRLDPIVATANFTLALPPAAKISGTISDPNHMLIPMMGVGGTGSSGISYYHCNSLDTGTYPDPVFFFPEGSTSSFFSASASHALYVRKGITCVTYANYAIATGSPGALPTVVGENTYAWLQDPTPQSPNAVTVTADLIRNIHVPDLGPRVTVTGTVKNARGAAITGAQLSVLSRSLSTAAVADKTFVGSLDVSSSGTYTLHVLPGSYHVEIALAKETASATTDPDAGASATADAAPDFSFSFPDLGAAGTCATLSPCCATLTANDKAMCDAAVSSGIDATCNSITTLLRFGGKCL